MFFRRMLHQVSVRSCLPPELGSIQGLGNEATSCQNFLAPTSFNPSHEDNIQSRQRALEDPADSQDQSRNLRPFPLTRKKFRDMLELATAK